MIGAKQIAGWAIIVVGGFALGVFRSLTAQDASIGEAVQGGLAVAGSFFVVLVILFLFDRGRQDR